MRAGAQFVRVTKRRGHSACAEGPLWSIMDLDEQAWRLRMHVEQLAGKIGERNVFCPASLHATASYIEHEWEQQGYAVVSGVRCLNLEITRSGGARDREILLIGAHYDIPDYFPDERKRPSAASVRTRGRLPPAGWMGR
jgi:hypothetical protein